MLNLKEEKEEKEKEEEEEEEEENMKHSAHHSPMIYDGGHGLIPILSIYYRTCSHGNYKEP